MWFGDIDIKTRFPNLQAPEGSKPGAWRAPPRILAARTDARGLALPAALHAIARRLRGTKRRREARQS